MAQQCTAKAKSTGVQCARYAIEGGTTCRVHGSGSKTAKAAAARRIAEQKAALEAEKAVTTLGLARDISPTEALLEEIRWTAGHVEWARMRLQQLDPDELTWGLREVKEKTSDDGYEKSTKESSAVHVWYELYMRERQHLTRVCEAAIRAGVEERRVRLAEQYADVICTLLDRVIEDLRLTPAQAAEAPAIVSRHLRLLAGGA